jgi:hypothetical protein
MASDVSQETDPETLALRAARYYDSAIGRPMSDIAKSVYSGRIRGFESHPEIAAFAAKYDIPIAATD